MAFHAPADEAYVRRVLAAARPPLSEKTARLYATNLRVLSAKLRAPLLGPAGVLLAPERHLPALRAAYPAPGTRRTVLTAVLALFKHDPALGAGRAGARARARARWAEAHAQLDALLEFEAARSAPTPRQAQRYTGYDEIAARYLADRRAPEPHADLMGSMRLLLLSFYVHQRPKRSDLGAVRVVDRRRPSSGAAARPPAAGNYLVLGAPSYLVVREHKTAKSYGVIEEDLEPGFVEDLLASLRRHPRDYLFVGPRTRGPLSNNQFSDFVRRSFLAMFGRATGTSLLRHAYITERIDPGAMALEELEAAARQMGQDREQQARYAFRRAAPRDAPPKTCTCTCVSAAGPAVPRPAASTK